MEQRHLELAPHQHRSGRVKANPGFRGSAQVWGQLWSGANQPFWNTGSPTQGHSSGTMFTPRLDLVKIVENLN